jgi:gliding motility-associated lipoprotein GldB
MRKVLILILFLSALISCEESAKKVVNTTNIEVSVEIDRFDQKFYQADVESLPALKQAYPYLFPVQTPDSIWLEKILDTDELYLLGKVDSVFPNFEPEKAEIEQLFQNIKYYYPNFKEPKVLSLITKVDYESKVIFADSLLLFAIDMYLGGKDDVYHDFPEYLAQNFKKERLTVDFAEAISGSVFRKQNKRQFIDIIVQEGKQLYLLELFNSWKGDHLIIGYSEEELEWAEANEEEIWKYFIEKKLLYQNDPDLRNRFVKNAPFSKFYLDIDKESPGKIGAWIGWQIVRSYMQNNNVPLHELLRKNEAEIFENSKYKPKR